MRALILIFPVLFLCGCSDGPAIRKQLAECEVAAQKGGNVMLGMYDHSYLQTCMQAAGYAWDETLVAPDERRCSKDIPDPFQEAACYRDDSWTGEGWAKATGSN